MLIHQFLSLDPVHITSELVRRLRVLTQFYRLGPERDFDKAREFLTRAATSGEVDDSEPEEEA